MFLLSSNLPLFFLYQLSADLMPPGIQICQLLLQHVSICCWWLLNNFFTSYIQCSDNSLLSPNAILQLLQSSQHIHIFIKMSSIKENTSSHTDHMERGKYFRIYSPLIPNRKIQSQIDYKVSYKVWVFFVFSFNTHLSGCLLLLLVFFSFLYILLW